MNKNTSLLHRLLAGTAWATRSLLACAALSLPALAAAPAAEPVPTARVIVKFKGNGALMRESALAARAGQLPRVQHAARLSQRFALDLHDGSPVAPGTQVLHARGISSAALVARLKLDPDVEFAEVDERVRRADVPNDPLYVVQSGGGPTPTAGQWYLRPPTTDLVSAIDAQSAWDVTTGSTSVVVAVLDTGVRPNHADLVGKLLPGADFVSADPPAGGFATANDGDGRDTDPSDPGDWITTPESNSGGILGGCPVGPSSWHGTQTAALIGASTNNAIGMASVGRNVLILPVRVLGKCGGFQSDVIAGMYWAAGLAIPPGQGLGTEPRANVNPAKVLNLSLGSASSCGASYRNAVAAVTAAGASVVVSAGNDAGLAVGQPANCPGAIGVGGLRHLGTKVGFSDVGPEIAISAPGGNCVNTSGPCLFPILTATNLGTTMPGGDTNSYTDSSNVSVGTSFSAPLVAGTAALMLSVNPALTASQVRVGLMKTVRAFPATGAGSVPACRAPDSNEQDECYCTTSTCGAGMLSTANAVTAATMLRAWIVPSATRAAPGTTITLDGANSWAAPSGTIASRLWEITGGNQLATLQGENNPSATLVANAAGTVVVRLTVNDGVGGSSFDETTIVIEAPAAPSSGGGSMSWPWLLALACAVAALRPRRRMS